jgi:cytochrome c
MSRFPSLPWLAAGVLMLGLDGSGRLQAAESAATAAQPAPPPLGIGRAATASEIAGWDIDIRPDGHGLPPGRGTPGEGEPLYVARCAACHGELGESTGRWPVLTGGTGSLASHEPLRTVGSYWPYTSTVIDYIRRAKPPGDAQSLSNDELYAITAYVLYLNDVITDESFELNERNLTSIRLPNERGFFNDDRETAESELWHPAPCMTGCAQGEARITSRARMLDVTPQAGKGSKAK